MQTQHNIYIVGSLANIEQIEKFAARLRKVADPAKFNIQDDWISHGPDPDLYYTAYCHRRGFGYAAAMKIPVAKSVFETVKAFIDGAAAIIMLQPCGRSAALEFGYAVGSGKIGVIIKPTVDYTRVEIMEQFAHFIAESEEDFFNSGIVTAFLNRIDSI